MQGKNTSQGISFEMKETSQYFRPLNIFLFDPLRGTHRSHWNIYVKKLRYRETGTQLGIHLHRLSAATPLPSTNRLRRPVFTPFPYGRGTSSSRPHMLSPPSTPPKGPHLSSQSDDDFDRDEIDEVDELCDLANNIPIEESFSCFADKRESTRTWFRVYAASIGPLHQVTHFEATPDDFRLLHSWVYLLSNLFLFSFACTSMDVLFMNHVSPYIAILGLEISRVIHNVLSPRVVDPTSAWRPRDMPRQPLQPKDKNKDEDTRPNWTPISCLRHG